MSLHGERTNSGFETPIRLLVADDHALVRDGLTTLLEGYEDIELVGAVADGSDAVSAAKRGQPDVILMDLEMPVMDGIEATRRIVRDRPDTRVVVLTAFADRERSVGALAAGACGYLLKDADPEVLLLGIRSAARGEAPFAPRAAAQLVGVTDQTTSDS